MKSLTIVTSFDVSAQIVSGSIPGRVASLMHEFGFDHAKAAFHWSIIPAISLPAHGLDHPGCIEDLAVIGSGILAASDALLNVKPWLEPGLTPSAFDQGEYLVSDVAF